MISFDVFMIVAEVVCLIVFVWLLVDALWRAERDPRRVLIGVSGILLMLFALVHEVMRSSSP